MWILRLNDMRDDHFESLRPAFRAETREALVALVERETVPGGYTTHDGRWGKTFRAGGPLEWYNPPSPSFGEPCPGVVCIPSQPGNLVFVGSREDWLEQAGRAYDAEVMSVPLAPIAPPADGEPVAFSRAPAAGQ
jgi:hypothetical protein